MPLQVRDHFCSKLDHTAVGISGVMEELGALLRRKDAALAATLARLRIQPTFYAFRWITLLMTQARPPAATPFS